MEGILNTIKNFIGSMGFNYIVDCYNDAGQWMGWQYLVMYAISFVLIYLAIVKKFEPLLLLPIAVGMLLANLPGANLIHTEFFFDEYYVEAGLVAQGEHASMSMMLKEVFNNGGLYSI